MTIVKKQELSLLLFIRVKLKLLSLGMVEVISLKRFLCTNS